MASLDWASSEKKAGALLLHMLQGGAEEQKPQEPPQWPIQREQAQKAHEEHSQEWQLQVQPEWQPVMQTEIKQEPPAPARVPQRQAEQPPAEAEEEGAWAPNPYQQEADAQVAAGAWPGMPLLFGSMDYSGMMQQTCDGSQVFMMAPMDASGQDLGCSGWTCESQIALGGMTADNSIGCWGGDMVLTNASMDCSWGNEDSSWGYYPVPVKEGNETSASAAAAVTSTDEGEQASDSQEESEKSAAEDADAVPGSPDGDAQGKYTRKLSHANVPRYTDMARFEEQVKKDEVTTLMVRNIPNIYTRSMLTEELDSLGFEDQYDFVYLPIDKSTQWSVGYAFVNFKTPEAAKRCITEMTGYTFNRYKHGSRKMVQISVAHIQGLERNLEYYSKTAVQSARVNAHRPHFVSNQQESQETATRPPRKQRPDGYGGSRHRHAGYRHWSSSDKYYQESGQWNRGEWN